MDITMLKGNSPQALMELIRRMFLEIHTCVPGEIIDFNFENQTATVRSCIRNIVIDENGKTSYIDLPKILDVPVVFLQSQKKGFSFTYPVSNGDQCLLFFSERSYDNWLENGSVQNPIETGLPRSHQYNDAFALVGISPYTSSIQGFNEEGIELRNKDRNVRLTLTDQSFVIHNGRVEVIVNEDNFIAKLEDENGLTLASINIDNEGNVNIFSKNTVNVSGNTVNVSGNTGNVIFTDLLNITCPNIIITGDVLVDGELFAKTYMVGSDPNKTVGVIASYNDDRIERPNANSKPV